MGSEDNLSPDIAVASVKLVSTVVAVGLGLGDGAGVTAVVVEVDCAGEELPPPPHDATSARLVPSAMVFISVETFALCFAMAPLMPISRPRPGLLTRDRGPAPLQPELAHRRSSSALPARILASNRTLQTLSQRVAHHLLCLRRKSQGRAPFRVA